MELQKALKDTNYYKGTIDGYYSSEVELAVTKFQQDNGLQVNGIAGSETKSLITTQQDKNVTTTNLSTIDSTSSGYLQLGSEGEDVKQLQRDLIKIGYSCGSCGADGDFGQGTKNAVMNFQRDNGISVDGIVGPETRKALTEALKAWEANRNEGGGATAPVTPPSPSSTSYLQLGSSGEGVKQLQRDLIKIGYSCGSCGADGDFGQDTKTAVMNFQRDNKISVDGVVGPETRNALNEALKVWEANKNEGGAAPTPTPTPSPAPTPTPMVPGPIPQPTPTPPPIITTPKTPVSGVLSSSTEEVAQIKKLEDISSKYYSSRATEPRYGIPVPMSQINDDNMSFIRSSKYAGAFWTATDGTIPQDYVGFVNKSDPNIENFFKTSGSNLKDPVTGLSIDFRHLIATLQGQFSTLVPHSWSGWAGDLATLTDDVKKLTNDSDDGTMLYNAAKILLNSEKSSFPLSDKLDDIDACNIANILKNNNISLSNAIENYYSSGVSKRYTLFINSFGGYDKFKSEVIGSVSTKLVTALKVDGLYASPTYPTYTQEGVVEGVFIDDIITNAKKEGYSIPNQSSSTISTVKTSSPSPIVETPTVKSKYVIDDPIPKVSDI